MPIDFPLAGGVTALTMVASAADRNLRFPNPNTNQLVYNLGTGAVERWTGAVWNPDLLFAGGLTPQTFNALATLNAGVVLTGTGVAQGFADYATLNGARQGGQVAIALWGPNPSGVSDIRLYNDGVGNYFVSVAGAPALEIDTAGNMYQLKSGTFFYPQGGAHQSVDGWIITNPANGITNTLLTRTAPQWMSPRGGWITGLVLRASGVMTGGAGTIATATVFKNGTATAITVPVTAGIQTASQLYGAPSGGAVPFNAADALDIRITTAASWTFTSGTVYGALEVLT